MTFATKKWIPTSFELETAIAEALAARALSLKLGGTGVAAAGADDAAMASDVLNTWGLTSAGIVVPARMAGMVGAARFTVSAVTYTGSTVTVTTSAPHGMEVGAVATIAAVVSTGTLAGLVNASQTVSAVASTTFDFVVGSGPTGAYTSGGYVDAPGKKGAVTLPPAGTQKRAFAGGGTFVTELEITSVVKQDGAKIADFESLGDADNRPYFAAAASGGRKTRIGSRCTIDPFSDLQLETTGSGALLTHGGNPVQTVGRPLRAMTNVAFGATFTTQGLPTPTIYSPGAAPAALVTSKNSFGELTYKFSTSEACGFAIPACTRRAHDPTLFMVFQSAFTQSRFWWGLFDGIPSGSPTLGTIKGVGIRFDHAIDSNTLQLVSSDGSAQTVLATGQAPTAGALQWWRLVHTGGGHWTFANYNFANSAWEGFTVTAATEPGTSDPLGIHGWLGTTSTSNIDRKFAPASVWLG